MSIISSNHRLVKVNGTEYSAGPGIVIEDSTISVDPNLSAAIDNKLDISSFSSYSATIDDELQYVSANAGNTYSAGDNIDIYEQDNDLYISAKDWTTDIANASSYAFNEATAQIPPVFDPTYMSGQIDNKLNKSDFDTYSGSVNTQITGLSGEFQTTSSLLDNKITAVRNDLNTVTTNTGYLHTDIQTTSGILSAAIDYVSANVGDEFPASANEAITAYQTYSGTYLTAHQDISNKLDTTAFSTVSGSFLTAVDLTPYYTTAEANTVSSMFSGAIDYVSANAGTTYTGVSPIVVTGNTISADSFDLNIGSGLAFENNTLYVSAQGGDPEVETVVKTNSADWGTITALSSTSSILSGAIDYVSANLPDGFTGINHDNNLSGDGNSIPLGLASSIKLQDPSIYTTATYGGSVSIEGIMPRLQLKTNNSSYNTLGEGGMTVTHPASSVGGGYTTSHYGEKMSLSYNDGDYYLHTMDTTKSGLGVTYKGAPNVKAYYNYSGVALTNDNGVTNEYVNVASIRNWNGVYDTVNTNSASWSGGSVSLPITGADPSHTSAYYGTTELYFTVDDREGEPDIRSLSIMPGAIYLNATFDEENYFGFTLADDHLTLTSQNDPNCIGDVYAESISSWNDTYYTVQSNSASWASHQDLSYISGQVDNKLDTTAFSTVSGTFLTAHQPISANEWNNVYETVEANSGSWTGGGGSIDTIPFVVQTPLVTGFTGDSAYIGLDNTAINLSAYVPYSAITDNYGDGYVHYINGSAIYASTADWSNNCNYANVAYSDSNGNTITNYYEPKLTIAGTDGTITAINSSAIGGTMTAAFELSAGAGISIVDDLVESATVISVTAAGGNPEVESYVQTNSASIDGAVLSYQTNSAVFNAKQDALTFSTADTLSAASNYGYRPTTGISGIGGSALIIPMAVIQYWNPRTNKYESAINQIYKDRIAADLDGQGNYIKDTYQKVSGVSANEWNDATTAYQTNSGSYLTSHQAISAEEWNSNYETVATNSGTWGGQSLPISAGAGIGLSMVDGVLVISVTGGN